MKGGPHDRFGLRVPASNTGHYCASFFFRIDVGHRSLLIVYIKSAASYAFTRSRTTSARSTRLIGGVLNVQARSTAMPPRRNPVCHSCLWAVPQCFRRRFSRVKFQFPYPKAEDLRPPHLEIVSLLQCNQMGMTPCPRPTASAPFRLRAERPARSRRPSSESATRRSGQQAADRDGRRVRVHFAVDFPPAGRAQLRACIRPRRKRR